MLPIKKGLTLHEQIEIVELFNRVFTRYFALRILHEVSTKIPVNFTSISINESLLFLILILVTIFLLSFVHESLHTTSTQETFLHAFLEILKHSLQNF